MSAAWRIGLGVAYWVVGNGLGTGSLDRTMEYCIRYTAFLIFVMRNDQHLDLLLLLVVSSEFHTRAKEIER